MKKRYIIFTPSYDENIGGIVVLNKLCSLLNDLGEDAYLYPYFNTYEMNKKNCFKVFMKCMESTLRNNFKKYKINESLNIKVFNEKLDEIKENDIVIYAENVFGNPLKAKNVVRWLLHQPGFHSEKIYYGENELYFKFNSAIRDFDFKNSKTSKHFLKIIHYPVEIYNNIKKVKKRKGTAYCLRKGVNKLIQHNLDDSILIDNKSHKEVSEIFKSVETFISYDTYTAYSIFAVLCGCKSIVVPDDGVSKEQWYPNETDRYGIAYGFSEDEEKIAYSTSHLVEEHIKKEEINNIKNVKIFIKECNEYFKGTLNVM